MERTLEKSSKTYVLSHLLNRSTLKKGELALFKLNVLQKIDYFFFFVLVQLLLMVLIIIFIIDFKVQLLIILFIMDFKWV